MSDSRERLNELSSHTRLLELVVHIAARVIDAATASLLLVDPRSQELAFVAAYPHPVSDLAAVRVPLGEGIAGLVAMTGQPMAISEARSDPRHASSIAEQTGYQPDSLVCVPLVFADEVIGVLELMDKHGAHAFDPGDIDTLGLFAQLAGAAIEQSRMRTDLASLLSQGPTFELAQLVREIAQAGAAEVQACAAMLRGFAGYIRAREKAR